MDPSYVFQRTADGSLTDKDNVFNETMHSDAGAYEEAVIKYVQACNVFSSTKNSVTILDVGFGIGYNFCAVVDEWMKRGKTHKISIISLEKDRAISLQLGSICFGDERDICYDLVKQAFLNGSMEKENLSIEVLFGDARQSVKMLEGRGLLFDVVFQDAFSPGKNPELWTLDYFRIIRKLMSDGGIISTYSSAPQIRRALIESGFNIAKAPSTGKKREGTIASPGVLEYGFSVGDRTSLFEDIKSVVYRDETLSESRENILTRRIDEMAEIRKNSLSRQDR